MRAELRSGGDHKASCGSLPTPDKLVSHVAQQLSLVTSFLNESAAILNASASVG
jgi:hypothetical protein